MFDFFKKSDEILSPMSGKVLELSQVPDQVFAQKMAGDGVAIEVESDVAVAPADGVIALIFKTNHAFAMILDNGLELLVHIGLDTVELDGQGFERLIEEGKKVKAGEPIIKIHKDFIKEKGYSLISPVLITNPDNLKEIKYNLNALAEAGNTAVITYKVK